MVIFRFSHIFESMNVLLMRDRSWAECGTWSACCGISRHWLYNAQIRQVVKLRKAMTRLSVFDHQQSMVSMVPDETQTMLSRTHRSDGYC